MSGSITPVLVGEPRVEAHGQTVTLHEAQVSRALGGGPKRRRSDPRWEVTDADLNMYALIVGRAPSETERLAALAGTSRERDALCAASSDNVGPEGAAPVPARRSWSPGVLCHYLREFYNGNISLRVTGPQVSAWVRQLSTEARRRLQINQARVRG